MYEAYTRQSLPSKKYRELLGSALCVFNSNNSFMIENIIRIDSANDWYELIDKVSGKLRDKISTTISINSGNTDIEDLFMEIVEMRNRIIHSFQITSPSGEQVLATKTSKKDGNIQFEITETYLMEFIKKNEELSTLLHSYRGFDAKLENPKSPSHF
ncbi:MAG TPA: selenium binding protein [Bacteroidales bacterium]|jgi:hypothetical protein|nr:selenium binding protein [Bacteroidales bacterium]